VVVGPQVVDISVDPLDQRRRRRRALLRVGLPVAGVALVVATILVIALYGYRANRAGALALSSNLLATLEQRVVLALSAHLDPAVRAARIARTIVPDGTNPERLPLIEALSTSLLKEIAEVDAVGFGDSEGNYVMVRRGADGGSDVKLVRNTPPPRQVEWVHRNAAGEEIGREPVAKDDFDPRLRPWFFGALGVSDVFWTGVYTFYTTHAPGLTVSAGRRAADGRIYVVEIDVTLASLSDFLSRRKIGQTGRAIIMDQAGRLIAAPPSIKMLRDSDGTSITARVDEVGDAVLASAYDRFRTDGYGNRTIDVAGRRYLTAVAPLYASERDWSLMIVVPEDDFVGYVAHNNRTALSMSLVVVALTVALAALLIRQGLRADRGARLLLDRQRAISRQSTAFAELAADAGLFDPAKGERPRALTETLAEACGARRASVWRLLAGGQMLHCEDSFERDTGEHTDGFELHREELPQFFANLLGGEEMVVADAARDRRTAELHRAVMAPLGTSALMAVPVRRAGQVVGAVCLEDAESAAGVKDFARAVANMIALGMGDVPVAPAREKPARETPAAASAGPRRVEADLRRPALDPATIEGEVHNGLSAMVFRFTDSLAMARRANGGRSLSDEIVCALQHIADAHDLPYVKLVGNEIIAAAGFEPGAVHAATRIADAALALRERCCALFEECDNAPEFRIGLDHGLAMGAAVGDDPKVFNLWGEAVTTAERMAHTALPGTIQATEAAYAELRHDFVFRPHGRYFLPGVGEARTFVLAGKL
jgi:class 3 adenylate cyclase